MKIPRIIEYNSILSQEIFDPEDLHAVIHNATFKPCQLSAKPSPSKLTRVICPTVCLDLISLGSSLLFTGTMPRDCYTLIFVTKCQRVGWAFNFAIEHNEGYMGFFPPGGTLDAYTPEGYANATLTVPEKVFETAVTRLFPEIPERILKNGAGMRISATEQAKLNVLLQSIKDNIDQPLNPLLSLKVRSQLEIELIDLFLVALRNGCKSLIPEPGLRTTGKLKRFRQARDYIQDHLHEPFSLADLSHELGMSRRGVELLFQNSLHIGPNAFLRHQRLHGARRALKTTPQSTGLVKQVALAWGFLHMGHFAREYRNLFGESPSETLHRNIESRSELRHR